MSSAQDSQRRAANIRKGPTNAPPISNPGHSGPTTFFLRSEQEVEKRTQRGRTLSRDSDATAEESLQKTPMASMMGDSSFGVQSLESTIRSEASPSEHSLSRVDSNASEASMETGAERNILAGRKRKAGNPVHPKIAAAGQRIISSEHGAQAVDSPVSARSAESPFRSNVRRGSVSSASINLSQPLTPLKMSPQPQSAMPSTPRSGSPKSFRLSDEEASVASDTNSQAIQSSSGEEEEEDVPAEGKKADAPPQLVMPSIAMPRRRPFTERGRRMGRFKVMVMGARGVGKTNLIRSICRMCEDVVHLDPLSGSSPGTSSLVSNLTDITATTELVEIGASTRPFPSWWTDLESRQAISRRKSIGDGVLERNLTFVDTPGFECGKHLELLDKYFNASLVRTSSMESLNDNEIVSLLSGDGGAQIDAVLYLFDPAITTADSPSHLQMDDEQARLLRHMCKFSNVIPLITRADTSEPEDLVARKSQLLSMFKSIEAQPSISRDVDETVANESRDKQPLEPYAVSSALSDDLEIDASVLMSSGYIQPLVPSELAIFVQQLLEPDNIARLRHLSATKFLLWRQDHLVTHLDIQNMQKQARLNFPPILPTSPGVTSTGSLLDEPSKVMVPYGSSSYFRSTSPGASDSSALSGTGIGASLYELPPYPGHGSSTQPLGEVHIAKWVKTIPRNLYGNRNNQIPTNPASEWTSSTEKAGAGAAETENRSLITTTTTSRAPRGKLNGEFSAFDPDDPLRILVLSQAVRRQGYFALQLAGIGGVIGAVAWWAMRNWADLQEFLGLAVQQPMSVIAVPAPTRGAFDVAGWKGFLGWER